MKFSKYFIRYCLHLLLCISCGANAASVYIYVNAQGDKIIADHPLHDLHGYTLQKKYGVDDYFGLADRPHSRPRRIDPVVSVYDDLIVAKANKLGVEAALLKAIVHVESAFDPGAISSKGATGLMQLMPGTAQRYGVLSRTDPDANMEGGGRYIKDLLTMFDQDLRLALAAYNAGENAVRRYQGIPPFPETRNYVESVITLLDKYRLNLPGTWGRCEAPACAPTEGLAETLD